MKVEIFSSSSSTECQGMSLSANALFRECASREWIGTPSQMDVLDEVFWNLSLTLSHTQ